MEAAFPLTNRDEATMSRWHFALLCVPLFALTCVAQDVPPPSRPADNGPSLADTMKFIEEKLGSIGRVNYVSYVHDNINGSDRTYKLGVEQSNVRASVKGCRIDYHVRRSRDGEVYSEKDAGFLLKDVQEVVVTTMEQRLKEVNSKNGRPEDSYQVDPPVFVIIAKGKNGEDFFDLYDESLGNRITSALAHAVELCGGGTKDPF